MRHLFNFPVMFTRSFLLLLTASYFLGVSALGFGGALSSARSAAGEARSLYSNGDDDEGSGGGGNLATSAAGALAGILKTDNAVVDKAIEKTVYAGFQLAIGAAMAAMAAVPSKAAKTCISFIFSCRMDC